MKGQQQHFSRVPEAAAPSGMQSPAPHSPDLPPDQEPPPTYPEETPQQKVSTFQSFLQDSTTFAQLQKMTERHNWMGRNNPAPALNLQRKTNKPTPSLYEKLRQLKSVSAVDTWGRENHKKRRVSPHCFSYPIPGKQTEADARENTNTFQVPAVQPPSWSCLCQLP